MEKGTTRNIHTHNKKEKILDLLYLFKDQYVILDEHALLYSTTSCRCGTPHVDVFSKEDLAKQEAAKFPLKRLAVFELDEDFYKNYDSIREHALTLSLYRLDNSNP